jgi:acyl-CoA thioesterase-1
MKVFLLSIALLATFPFVSCRNGSDQALNQPVPAGAPPATKSLPKIVALGDSLTAGAGLQPSQSYPSLLQKRLDSDGYRYQVVNAGISGDTSAGGLRRVDWSVDGNVQIVILELGANDILRGLPISEMKKNLGKIIEHARSKGCEVLLAGMESPTSAGPEYRKQAHDAFVDLARQYKCPLIPFFLDRVATVESLNQADGIHPNAEGTAIVTETVYTSLRPLLEK